MSCVVCRATQCIVSPPDPDDYLKVKFKKLRVPVVGKQWIIQSLLSQVAYHHHYHHTFAFSSVA